VLEENLTLARVLLFLFGIRFQCVAHILGKKKRKEKDMMNKLRNRKGFTLIELLIVVAIIGILAAIAIPQFAAYRMRGYNSAANSDIRNAKTALEAVYADTQQYP
jgi:type IV pilus assembly protein PilA